LIYQRRDAGPAPVPQEWAVEDLMGEWDALASLARFVRYRDFGRDDTAFYDVASALSAAGRPGDAVLLDDDLGRGLLARWYDGPLPLAVSADDPAMGSAGRVWGVYWASPDRAVERNLSLAACPAATTWYKNVRVVLNGAPSLGAPRALGAQFGDMARLLSASTGSALNAGGILCVQLEWSPLARTAERYKAFVHLMDSAGRVVAQTDSEPQAGFMPTDQWQPGVLVSDRHGIALPDNLPPGAYQLMTGLYRLSDGARLPARDAQSRRYPNDEAPLGELTVR